jgi:putative Holliday junction resolvase
MLIQSKEEFLKIFNSLPHFKILGIDYGRIKTGVAVYNSLIRLTMPRPTIMNLIANPSKISCLINEEKIDGIVIGLPLKKSGALPDNFSEIELICQNIMTRTELPYYLSDERYTTALANVLLKQLKMKRYQRNKVDDQLSACIILEKLF